MRSHRRRARLRALLLIGMMAPGVWLRSPVPPPDSVSPVLIEALDPAGARLGSLPVTGAWHLRSGNDRFGGYSALAPLPDSGALLAVSDAGQQLTLPRPGPAGLPRRLAPAAMRRLAAAPGTEKRDADVEAVTVDPSDRRLWIALERRNRIERYVRPQLAREGAVSPPAMGDWGANTGAEAMTRLADGRFIALAEARSGWTGADHAGVVFAGDPVAGARGTRFTFAGLTGYRPVDMAQLPDGRVLVLLRRLLWGWPLSFDTALMVADPASLRPGARWRGRVVARGLPEGLRENYEGLAVTQQPGGGTAVWLISDDNFRERQRTLLLRVDWPG